METKIINEIAIVKSNEIIIKDVQSAIDFIMTIKYETKCNKIALNKGAVVEDFFILSTGLAGEILQKFINYKDVKQINTNYIYIVRCKLESLHLIFLYYRMSATIF